jgi:hypothetical protein
MKEEFEGSALRELFTPVVADRGRTPAPTDAIVAAGRRRVARRRAAVAGGALAIVAAVPVAAAAIAADPAKTDTAGTAKKPNVVAPITSPVRAGTPTGATPARSATPSPTRTGAQSSPSSQTSSLPGSLTADPDGAAALPRTPTVLASGTMEGRHWSVAGVASGGNSAPTAKDRCLKLLISEDGHAIDPSMGDRLLYCVPGDVRGFRAEDLTDTIPNGAGTMVVGTVPAAVAKVVAHVDGITAPITTATLPAPGASAASIYIVPVPLETMAHTVFDEYDKQGVKIGSWDNSDPAGP